MDAITIIFQAELKRIAQITPFNPADYIHISNTVVNFLMASLIFVEMLSKCSDEEWEIYQQLFDFNSSESVINVDNPMSTPEVFIEELNVLNSLDSHVSKVRGVSHFAVDGIKILLVFSICQLDELHKSFSEKIVGLQLPRFCRILDSTKGAEKVIHLSLEIMETDLALQKRNSLIEAQIPLCSEPNSEAASVENDNYDGISIADEDSTSKEAPIVVPSTILIRSESSSANTQSSPTQSSGRSTGPGKESPDIILTEKNPSTGAIAYSVTSQTFQVLQAYGVNRVREQDSKIDKTIKQTPHGADPYSAIQDLETPKSESLSAWKALNNIREDGFDRKLLEKVMRIESVESVMREVPSPMKNKPDNSSPNFPEMTIPDSLISIDTPSNITELKRNFAEFGNSLKAQSKFSQVSM